MEEINQYITFTLGNEEYGICVSNVKEILGVTQITRIPRMPEYMSGVINLRGSVVSVVDLQNKFGMGHTELTEETAILVIEVPTSADDQKKLNIGIFADKVNKVITLESSAILPPPQIGIEIDTTFIAGMGHIDDRFITILNISKILTQNELLEEQIIEA